MTQAEKARRFADLHVPGTPVVLYNIWDAGGARTLAEAGAKAIATASWSIAAAHGYSDGQDIPLNLYLQIVSRVTDTVDLPVTMDFEGGFAEAPQDVAANATRVIGAGAIGINFEDQVVGGSGLHAPAFQSERIAAMRRAAEAADMPLFINARTDLFLKEGDRAKHQDLMAETKERASAYAEAGASGFFAPGLVDPDLIGALCEAVDLPVNILMIGGAPSVSVLASLGVARVSYGPGPYREAQRRFADRFREISGAG